MVIRVLDQCLKASAHRVIVATDSEEVAQCVEGFGYEAIMTRSDHVSGTDRLAEAAARLHIPDDDIVVNVQGDEPLIEPDVDQQKLMGGLLTITWGCLASRTRSDLQEADRWGRWVTTTLLGRGGRRIKVINAYRWPITTQGGLAARECRLRGW
ncbi:MAG: hypothetical protein RLY65_1609, partial [Pseudomonadota bacterium]